MGPRPAAHGAMLECLHSPGHWSRCDVSPGSEREGAAGDLQPRWRTVVDPVSVAGTTVMLSLGLLVVGCKTLSFTRLAPARTRSRRSGVMNSHFRRRFSCARFASPLEQSVLYSSQATA